MEDDFNYICQSSSLFSEEISFASSSGRSSQLVVSPFLASFNTSSCPPPLAPVFLSEATPPPPRCVSADVHRRGLPFTDINPLPRPSDSFLNRL